MLFRCVYESSHEGPTKIIEANMNCLMTSGIIFLDIAKVLNRSGGEVASSISESTIPHTEATTSAFALFMCQCHKPNVSCKATASTYIPPVLSP